MGTQTNIATGADGIRIGYDSKGRGPTVVLVGAALSDRSDHRRLQGRLGARLRAVNYDRRGRGASDADNGGGVVGEIGDLAAVIEATGGPVTLFGSSSGAVLAMRAAARLGPMVNGVVAYEPPMILDDSRPPAPADARERIGELLASGCPAASVRYFYQEVMRIPRVGVLAMRLMPGWSRSVGMAGSLLNDLAVMEGLQTGGPFDPGTWAEVKVPTLVLTGSKSEDFFHRTATALAADLPDAQARVMPGLHHGSAAMGSAALAEAIVTFVHTSVRAGSQS